MQNYRTDSFGQQRDIAIEVRPTTSKLATWSFGCSLFVVAPLVPLAGAVMGFMAQRELRSNAARRGGWLADWGLVLGLLFTALQAYAGIKIYELAMTIDRGPSSALSAGFDGDTGELLGWFPSDKIGRSDAAAFVAELRARYGAFESATAESGFLEWRPGTKMDYTLRFEGGTVEAQAEVVMAGSSTGVSARLGSLRVIDREFGDVALPAAPGPRLSSVDEPESEGNE